MPLKRSQVKKIQIQFELLADKYFTKNKIVCMSLTPFRPTIAPCHCAWHATPPGDWVRIIFWTDRRRGMNGPRTDRGAVVRLMAARPTTWHVPPWRATRRPGGEGGIGGVSGVVLGVGVSAANATTAAPTTKRSHDTRDTTVVHATSRSAAQRGAARRSAAHGGY